MGNLDSLDIARQAAVDETLTKMLLKIIKSYGWPTSEMVGKDGVAAAWLILQHAEHDVQKSMLGNVRVSFEVGDLDGQSYALLFDRVNVNDGLPQRYGTQMDIVNGEFKFFPIEDPGNLNVRRSQVGLVSISEYIKHMEDVYGIPYKGDLK